MEVGFVSATLPKSAPRRARGPCMCAKTKNPNSTRRTTLQLIAASMLLPSIRARCDELDVRPSLKVSGGSASTSATGRKSVVKTVTRGVNLEGADFSGGAFEGVSFQQSILRQANFDGCQLRDASFFDADLSGASFKGADLRGANFELANIRDADFTNADLSGAYIGSTTKMAGISIQGSDWSDTLLRKDQQSFLCKIASGTNESTGVGTKDSLMCP